MCKECEWTNCRENGTVLISLSPEEYLLCRKHLSWIQEYVCNHTENELTEVKEAAEDE